MPTHYHQLNLIVLVYTHDNIIPVGRTENKVVLLISNVAANTIKKSGGQCFKEV
jgi:hypothetical protein